MKKVIIVVALAAILATGTVFADHPDGWGVGLLGSFGSTLGDNLWNEAGTGGGLVFSLKAPQLPIYWGINLDFNSWYFGLGVSGDYYLIDQNIVDEVLGWYLGVGVWVGFSFWDMHEGNGFGLTTGGRVPVGLSVQIPIEAITLEFFAAFVPKLGLGMFTSDYYDETKLFFNLGAEVGFRIWF